MPQSLSSIHAEMEAEKETDLWLDLGLMNDNRFVGGPMNSGTDGRSLVCQS